MLTQRKIDAVAYKGTQTFLIEIKPVANARALGQILMYQSLYRTYYPEVRDPVPMIVCGTVERDLDAMWTEHGILIEVA